MDTEPPSTLYTLVEFLSDINWPAIVSLAVLLVLLLLSALISGSEVAFFSLKPSELEEIERGTHPNDERLTSLLQEPENLLATILISNNFVNVGIVILSTFFLELLPGNEEWGALVKFAVEILAVTGALLLFGEILPKVYANAARLNFARSVVRLIAPLHKLLRPLSHILAKAVARIKVENRQAALSVDDLEHALELTTDEESSEEEQRILKGIVRFGSTTVKEIMTPRTSLCAIDVETPYTEALERITESGYSRIPVFKDRLDQVEGLLYVQDLLPHIDAPNDFQWSGLMRPPFFVPESKKIDDLLKEFQRRRIHLAVVVDEFGGTSGVITLEDVIEEIVGEISDEFDDDDLVYSKLDDHNFVFEAQTSLLDFCRVLGESREQFDVVSGESETLAGLVLELSGKFLNKGEKIEFGKFTFQVESVNQRRLLQIKVTLKEEDHEE